MAGEQRLVYSNKLRGPDLNLVTVMLLFRKGPLYIHSGSVYSAATGLYQILSSKVVDESRDRYSHYIDSIMGLLL